MRVGSWTLSGTSWWFGRARQDGTLAAVYYGPREAVLGTIRMGVRGCGPVSSDDPDVER